MAHDNSRISTTQRLASFYRLGRYYCYALINPFDALFRKINRMGHFPPIYLRRHVSCLGTLDGAGSAFAAQLKFLTGLKANHRILDLGCGCGLLELALESVEWRGELVGVDIHKPCIAWAKKRISNRVPSFQFFHADIYNAAYWPGGTLSAQQWFDQFTQRQFDLVVAKSLLTHMLPEESSLYLKEILGRLKPGGKALVTFFLLTHQSRAKGPNPWGFKKMDPVHPYAVQNELAPTAAVAYEETFLKEQLQRLGAGNRYEIFPGSWFGNPEGVSFQDFVVITKGGG